MKFIITINPHGGKKLGSKIINKVKPLFDNERIELFIIENCQKSKTDYSCLLTSRNEESFIKWITIGIKNSFFYSFKYLDTFDQIVSLKFKNVSLSNISSEELSCFSVLSHNISSEEFKLIIPEGTDIVRLEGNVK